MPAVYFHKCQDSFPNVYCYIIWQSQFVLDGSMAFIFINARTFFPMSTAMSLDSRSLFSMDAFRLFSWMKLLFSQPLLLCILTVAVCSQWMPVYEPKTQDFSQCLLKCSFTVTVCSRWMPFIYENRHQDSSSNVYCYLPWQSQFVLDWCLPFIFINARTLFPTSTAVSFDSRSLFSMDAWRLWK